MPEKSLKQGKYSANPVTNILQKMPEKPAAVHKNNNYP